MTEETQLVPYIPLDTLLPAPSNNISTESYTSLSTSLVTSSSTSFHKRNYPYNSHLQGISNLCSDISSMVNTLSSISKIYELIDIQNTDVYITLASTKEIFSVNQLIKDSIELKKLKESNLHLAE
jgi:hypothetical protein